jgi:hypothetical protein
MEVGGLGVTARGVSRMMRKGSRMRMRRKRKRITGSSRVEVGGHPLVGEVGTGGVRTMRVSGGERREVEGISSRITGVTRTRKKSSSNNELLPRGRGNKYPNNLGTNSGITRTRTTTRREMEKKVIRVSLRSKEVTSLYLYLTLRGYTTTQLLVSRTLSSNLLQAQPVNTRTALECTLPGNVKSRT